MPRAGAERAAWIDFASNTLHVVQQVKLSRSKAVFAPPKGGKLRDVPLPEPVADALRAHMKQFPPVEITLPWKVADGPPVTKRLIFTGPRGGHIWRTSLNEEVWKRALASAEVIPERKPGESYAGSRENGMHALRHFYTTKCSRSSVRSSTIEVLSMCRQKAQRVSLTLTFMPRK